MNTNAQIAIFFVGIIVLIIAIFVVVAIVAPAAAGEMAVQRSTPKLLLRCTRAS